VRSVLPGDDADVRGVAKFGEQVLAVFPGEPECAHIGGTDSGHCISNGGGMSGIEVFVQESGLAHSTSAVSDRS